MTLPDSPQVQHLLDRHGIARDFINYAGETQVISHANRLGVLTLMGVDPTSGPLDDLIEAAGSTRADDWLPAAIVVTAGLPEQVALQSDTQGQVGLSWHLTLESGERLAGEFSVPEFHSGKTHLPLPALPAGYHQLELTGADRSSLTCVIAAPDSCHRGDWEDHKPRLAGLSLHLYCLRSSRNWGIGDFTDLALWLDNLAPRGIDFIVLNPLHLLDVLNPDHCSPYSPMDRRFLNPLYIDIEAEPDFNDHEAARDYVAGPAFQERLNELRSAELVDYASVSHLKYTVLSKMYKYFRKTHLTQVSARGRSFLDWTAERGEVLMQFGQYQASRQRLSMHEGRKAEFHLYLQWLAETQLERCQVKALDAGMAIGLVRDLAVGSDRDGAEVNLNPGLFSTGASIGAPPDPLAPQGQNWGLPPIDPVALKQSGYRHFIELLRSNMSHCGALRIDHIMSLMRLWWCPGQDHSGKGAYVAYPADELFALLRLESHRNRCIVIGEDLGIVPPEIRRLMWDSGVFSNRIFYFEKYDAVHFKHPQDYDIRALAMIANHDVPTLAAWWNRYDLTLRDEIGLFDSAEDLVAAIGARESDLIQVLHWLNDQQLLPATWQNFDIHRPFDHALSQAILRANASSSAALVSVQPEDLLLMERPINIPGTHTEYPNWRRKLAGSIDELIGDADAVELLDTFITARQG